MHSSVNTYPIAWLNTSGTVIMYRHKKKQLNKHVYHGRDEATLVNNSSYGNVVLINEAGRNGKKIYSSTAGGQLSRYDKANSGI